MVVDPRKTAAADALGSTRAEGIEPSPQTLAVIERWAAGELSDADLEQTEREIVEAATVKPAVASR